MATHQIKGLIISMAKEHLQGKISSNNNIKFCFNIRDSFSTQYTYALVQVQGGGGELPNPFRMGEVSRVLWKELASLTSNNHEVLMLA